VDEPALGHRSWVVPDGYLPAGEVDGLVSHEAICVLNTGDQDAHLRVTVYLEDADPLEFTANVPAQRTRHLRVDDLRDGDGRAVPRQTPYAVVVRADRPVVVQHSRLDVSTPRTALMTTIAHPVPG
jgi:hypothetical protein